MEQHEVVFNCTKRALEKALFSYTLSANEVYDAALMYTGDEKNVDRKDDSFVKHVYAAIASVRKPPCLKGGGLWFIRLWSCSGWWRSRDACYSYGCC